MMDVMAEMKMVVGLGNPGGEYVDTRHNAGFMVIDSLAAVLRIDVRKRRFGACFGEGGFGDKRLILLKPWRFMNFSGQVVATALGFYELDSADLLVVTDDMALPVGRIRLRAMGSSGGHNGLCDIIEKVGTSEFARCRVGIGHSDSEAAVEFVLSKPTESEKVLLNEAIEKAKEAVLCWAERGIEAAMNEFNC